MLALATHLVFLSPCVDDGFACKADCWETFPNHSTGEQDAIRESLVLPDLGTVEACISSRTKHPEEEDDEDDSSNGNDTGTHTGLSMDRELVKSKSHHDKEAHKKNAKDNLSEVADPV